MLRRCTLCLLMALLATQQFLPATSWAAKATKRAAASTWWASSATEASSAPIGAAAELSGTASDAFSSTADDYTTPFLTVQEEIALNLLNQDRISAGLPPLAHDPALSRIARMKSEDMRDGNYFAHQSPTWGSAKEMLTTLGYPFRACGENIARHATVVKSQAAFMSSAGHRRNILSPNWERVGVGVCTDRNGHVYVTQLFAR